MRRGFGGASRDQWTEKGSDQDRKAALSIRSLSLKKKRADKEVRQVERGKREKELDTGSAGESVRKRKEGELYDATSS